MATTIPADARDKALFLYHPNHDGAKRIDISARDPEAQKKASDEIAALKREGWSEKRYARMMYHKQFGSKVVRDPKEAARMEKLGWGDEPFTGEGVHPDAAHPHEKDDHRIIHLENEKAE